MHRGGLFIFAAETCWADHDPPDVAAANLHWLDEFHGDIFGDTPPGHSYQNFPDPMLKDWRRAYYGENYHRLVRVKRKYDPAGFFRYPQAIGSCRPQTAPPDPPGPTRDSTGELAGPQRTTGGTSSQFTVADVGRTGHQTTLALGGLGDR